MGSEARARLGLAGLLAITLFSFNQVFATGDYPGPALLGILIAVALVMVGRRLGLGTIVTIAGSLVALIAYLCLVFQADKTLRGLATPSALEALWKSLENAYSRSQLDFAPVPPRPGYVVMVVTGLWLAAVVGELATFRWRRPLLASLPCIGLFALVMVVGTGEAAPLLVALFLVALFAFWGLESSHRLRAWGRWVPTWKEHESEPEPAEVTGTLARRMGAACVLMGLVVPLFLPALGDGLLVWRNSTGDGLPGEGGGTGGAIDPLVSVRPQLIDQPETELFEVTSLRPSYWRLVTYTQFDGVSWHSSSDADSPSQSGTISTEVDPGDLNRTVRAGFVMRALDGERLPATGLPTEVEFTGSNADEYDLTYDAENGDVEIGRQIVDGLRYDVSAVVPEASFRNLTKASSGESVDPRYRQIPTNLSDVVFETANRWTEGIDNPFRQLVAIQNRLRGFDYSLDVEDTGSDDYLGDFLTVTRRGFCQQFASAFAILGRLKGFSTRVVVGFLPGTTSLSSPTTYSVRGTHAHVWPEVYFTGYGWVPFEPTPRGPAPPPAYTVPGVGFGVGARPEVQGAGGAQDPELGGRAAEELANEPINPGGVQEPGLGNQRVNLEWKKTFTRIALFVAIVALAYVIVTPAWKLRRIRARYSRARSSRARAAAAFAHFQEEAGDLVSRRAPAESATAYAARLAALRKVPARPALKLASIYEASEYAPTEPSDSDASEARDLARQLRASIWGGASWWDRGQRLLSPAWNGRKAA